MCPLPSGADNDLVSQTLRGGCLMPQAFSLLHKRANWTAVANSPSATFKPASRPPPFGFSLWQVQVPSLPLSFSTAVVGTAQHCTQRTGAMLLFDCRCAAGSPGSPRLLTGRWPIDFLGPLSTSLFPPPHTHSHSYALPGLVKGACVVVRCAAHCSLLTLSFVLCPLSSLLFFLQSLLHSSPSPPPKIAAEALVPVRARLEYFPLLRPAVESILRPDPAAFLSQAHPSQHPRSSSTFSRLQSPRNSRSTKICIYRPQHNIITCELVIFSARTSGSVWVYDLLTQFPSR
jgi:hypothetical protein